MSKTTNSLYIEKDGKEIMFFKDKKTGFIIRDFYVKDAMPYYNAMLKDRKLNGEEKKLYAKEFKKIVDERIVDKDLDYRLVITNLSGKIVGGIEVHMEEFESDAILTVHVKDEYLINTIGEDIIETIKHMHEYFKWFDNISLKKNDKIVPLNKAIA